MKVMLSVRMKDNVVEPSVLGTEWKERRDVVHVTLLYRTSKSYAQHLGGAHLEPIRNRRFWKREDSGET
jgi:hypothetical protein